MYILLFLMVHLMTTRMYYLTDIKYNSPYCAVSNMGNNSVNNYNITNIMGSIEITNDPLVQSLNFKIYLSVFIDDMLKENVNMNVESCELCNIDAIYCKNGLLRGHLIFSEDVTVNFRVIIKKLGNYGFSHNKDDIVTKYKITSFIKDANNIIYSNIKIPIEDLLSHNNDSYSELSCDSKIDILLHVIVSTNNMTIQRDFVLLPIDIYNSIDNQIYIDSYQLLCIPGKELLSSFDCSQSSIYRAIHYELQNCLIPTTKTMNNNDNIFITNLIKNVTFINDDDDNCSVYNHLYYNTLFYMELISMSNNIIFNYNWCNESLKDLLTYSFFEKTSIIDCYNYLNMDMDIDINDTINIYTKPFYRLYKETIIALLNYANCQFVTNNIRNFDIEKLLYHSIGVLMNSCLWKDTFLMDISDYEITYNKLLKFNLLGTNDCKKCDISFFKPKITYYCQSIIDNFDILNNSLIEWKDNETLSLLNDNQDDLNTNDTTKNKYGELFDMILEPYQYIESNILFTLFLIIGVISSIIVIFSIIKYFIIIKYGARSCV